MKTLHYIPLLTGLLLTGCTINNKGDRVHRSRIKPPQLPYSLEASEQEKGISHTGWYELADSPTALRLTRTADTLYLEPRPAIGAADFLDADPVQADGDAPNAPAFRIAFTTTGTRRFGELTQRSLGRQLALLLCNKVAAVVLVQSAVTGGELTMTAQDYSPDEVRKMLRCLKVH